MIKIDKAKKEAKQKAKRIQEIDAQLEQIDKDTIRPLRAGETDRLAALEKEAVKLRMERAKLV